VADVSAIFFSLLYRTTHGSAIVPVETVALDDRGCKLEATEDMFECGLDRGGSGSRGAGDRNDRV
jgi:hypothetical protein